MNLIIKAIIIGFSIAAPVGPMAILCINRTLNTGFLIGIITGLGIATADAVYGCIVGFGLTAVSNYLITHKTIIHIIGGLILCYLGIKILFSKPQSKVAEPKISGNYLSAFFSTLMNPMTIIAYIAVLSGIGIGITNPDVLHAIAVVLGIFVGSSIWWLILSTAVTVARRKTNPTVTRGINILSGLIILGFGVWIIIQ